MAYAPAFWRNERDETMFDPQYSCFSFSLGESQIPEVLGLANLLENLAGEVRKLDGKLILDVTLSSEIAGDGEWWTARVYYADPL